jgi:hypothetical protein
MHFAMCRIPKYPRISWTSGNACSIFRLSLSEDRAITQAVNRWLPTVAAGVQAQVRSCGICGGQSGTGAGFLRVLRFPLPILILPTAPHSSEAGTIGQLVGGVPSGLSLTPPQETKKKNVFLNTRPLKSSVTIVRRKNCIVAEVLLKTDR